MDIFSCPDEVPAPTPDYRNYDNRTEMAKEEAHKVALKTWLAARGFTGKHTGGIAQFQVADGYAQYMLADAPRGSGLKTFLIHLPYGDAWQYQGVEHFPKKAIVEEIERRDRLNAMFS
jgi:hypothetical protein